MSDKVPTPDELAEICRYALAFCENYRRWMEGYHGNDYRAWSAVKQQLKAVMMRSCAGPAQGWPDDTIGVLKTLWTMLDVVLGTPTPADFPDLEERIRVNLLQIETENAQLIPPHRKPKPNKLGPRYKQNISEQTRAAIIAEREAGTIDRSEIAKKVSEKLGFKVDRGKVNQVLNTETKRKNRQSDQGLL
jgi:hypothetical protein